MSPVRVKKHDAIPPNFHKNLLKIQYNSMKIYDPHGLWRDRDDLHGLREKVPDNTISK